MFLCPDLTDVTLTSSHPGTNFHQLQQLMAMTAGCGEHNTLTGESMFSEGLCNEDTTNEHIYKQVIPVYPFLYFFPLLVQASLQAFSMACFPRPSVGACVWTFREWRGVKRTGDLFLCLRGVEQIKEQNPAQRSRSIHTSPRCSVRADASLDNLPSSQLLPVKPGQHLHSSVVTVR